MNRVQEYIKEFPILANGIEEVDWTQLIEFFNFSLNDYALRNIIINKCSLSREWWEEEWYPGSLLYSCGLTLFTIIYCLKPKDIAEVGAFLGMSSLFMADALENKDAHINSVDRWEEDGDSMYGGVHRGHTIKKNPPKTDCVTLVTDDAVHYLSSLDDNSMDFIFEDTDHTYDTTLSIIKEIPRVLRPSGILASHDAHMKPVNNAYRDYFGLDNCTLLSNGIILWRKQ